MISINLLLRLLAVHFIMDFLLQSSKMVDAKTKGIKRKRIRYNLIHSTLHAVVAYVVVADWGNWVIPVVILVSHFAIDYWYKRDRKGLQPFLIDQGLHILVLVGLWIFATDQCEVLREQLVALVDNNSIWLMGIAYILMLQPASVLIKEFVDKWEEKGSIIRLEKGLENAGKWIGYFERILILTFVFINCLEAIGFLLAAKSIFRYGDLKELKDIKMTEYVLIGTLASFSIAIVIGMLFRQLAINN